MFALGRSAGVLEAQIRENKGHCGGVVILWLHCMSAFLLCVNVVLTLGHAQMGTPIPAQNNYGVGEPALAFSAGYAILHLTSDLAQNLREPEPVS